MSKGADEVNLVFPWCERIPLSVETSERFLSVNGSGKRVVKMAFDENIKKGNLLVLFKFNGEFNVPEPAIEIRKELNSGVLIVK